LPASTTERSPTRAIVLLAVAAFAAQAMVRVTDSLLPQIAADFNTTVGTAAIIVTAYAFTHGSVQLIIGPVGDKFGKYRSITIACALCAVLVALCGLAQSLPVLAIVRLCSGLAAGWIVPLSLAYVGDVIPYERRQQVIGTYLSGQILGQLFGQAGGGVLGDLLGWRNVFFILAAVFAIASVALIFELLTNPLTRAPGRPDERSRGFVRDYAAVLRNPWARAIVVVAIIESSVAWGAFTYVGADLHLRFGLSFTLVGLVVGAFAIGGLIYSASVRVLVARLGQPGLAFGGGAVLAAAYLILAVQPVWWLAPIAVTAIGLGFYMLHNTLQTVATQMTPEARGTAVALFSSALYIGQAIGVAIGALIVDRLTAAPLFVAAAIGLFLLGWWFARALRQRLPS
jgi:YNFM family putative membrane transporter